MPVFRAEVNILSIICVLDNYQRPGDAIQCHYRADTISTESVSYQHSADKLPLQRQHTTHTLPIKYQNTVSADTTTMQYCYNITTVSHLHREVYSCMYTKPGLDQCGRRVHQHSTEAVPLQCRYNNNTVPIQHHYSSAAPVRRGLWLHAHKARLG